MQEENSAFPVADENDEPEQSDSQYGHSEPVTDEQSVHLRLSESSYISEPSGEDIDFGYSDDESSVDPEQVGTYWIPMRRYPDKPGVLPRSSNLPPTRTQQCRSSSFAGSSEDEEEIKQRPQRPRQKPARMRSDDWMLGQVYTFTVNPDQVSYI